MMSMTDGNRGDLNYRWKLEQTIMLTLSKPSGKDMKENCKSRHFASDNYAGICPEAFAALAQANTGHEISYGDDAWTAKASDLIRDVFDEV